MLIYKDWPKFFFGFTKKGILKKYYRDLIYGKCKLVIIFMDINKLNPIKEDFIAIEID